MTTTPEPRARYALAVAAVLTIAVPVLAAVAQLLGHPPP